MKVGTEVNMRRSKMFYGKCFKSFLYIVKMLFIWNIFIKDVKTSNVFKGNVPDSLTLSKVLNFVGPILKSFPAVKPVFRTSIETAVDKVIREKVAKLRSLLQDDDAKHLEEKLFFEDKDETTIIEFLPKTEENKNISNKDDAFKTNIKKYKKIREKINKALTKEAISDKTKNLIVKTLDDLIRKLVGSQCKWKRNLRADGNEDPAMIASKWNQGLNEVKTILSNLLKNDSTDSRRNDEVPKFLDNLQILFKSVSKDIDTISKKYKIQCEFVPKSRPSKSVDNNSNALRNSWDKTDDEADKCRNVIICSNEMKEFMRHFYIALNDTAVSVIRNYAEMYMRDVITGDELERNTVMSLLNKLSGNTEGKVRDIFIHETNNLKLDKDKKIDANINALTDYVKNAIENVKVNIKSMLKAELVVLRDKIQKVVSDDIKVNLDVDLGNLEREFIAKICNIFRLCNGKYGGRRLSPEIGNKNSLYVQVQLTLDDDLADINNFRRILNAKNSTVKQMYEVINVTRTTHVYNNTIEKK